MALVEISLKDIFSIIAYYYVNTNYNKPWNDQDMFDSLMQILYIFILRMGFCSAATIQL